MKLKLLHLIVFLIPASGLMAADAPPPISVAVYDFAATGEALNEFGPKTADWNASKWNAWRETIHDFGPKVTALVAAGLSTEPNLALVERAELAKALNEQAFGLSGMINSEAAAKIGQITGAKVLVAGQVFATDDSHLTVVASIIGTETTRLYAVKVEGAADRMSDLTAELSRKIAKLITAQATNLVAMPAEPEADRLVRMIKSLSGKHRPAVSVSIVMLRANAHTHSTSSEIELGAVLLKAGFPVVDENSDQKADIEITGTANYDNGTKRGDLYTCSGETELKVQDRRSGRIITFDRQPCSVTDPSERAANRAVQARAVDELAERILPLLAQ